MNIVEEKKNSKKKKKNSKKKKKNSKKKKRGTAFRKKKRERRGKIIERTKRAKVPKNYFGCVPLCNAMRTRTRREKNSKKKNSSSVLHTLQTHTQRSHSSSTFIHENKNNRVLRIRILRMTEVPTKVVAFEKENVSSLPKTNEENVVQKSSKGVPNLPSPPSPLGDEIQNDELDEEEEEEEERATIEEAAIEKMKEQNDDKEEEEEEEDFIRIKRRVRGTNEKEEEEEEVIDDAADIDAKKTNDKEEEEREDVNNNNTVEKSFKKKTLKHKSGERVEKVASKKNTSGQGEAKAEGDKFEFELEEEEEEEEMEEDDDEERILERRFAETGRLSEDEEEDEESESELNFSSSEEEENESSSDSEVEDNEGGRRRRRGGRKTTKKGGGKKKKAIDPNDKEAVMRQKKEEADEAHEKLMRKTAKHVHFPGYRVQAERTSFLPVIEKLQNNLRMVENDENLRARYPRPPPSPEKKEFQAEEDAEGAVNDGVNEEVSEDEGEDGGKEKTNFDEIDDMDLLSEEEEEEEEEMVELEEESDSDDEVAAAELIRKSLSAKKTMKVVVNDPAHAEDKDNTAKENQDDEDEDDGELSEEEDMTGKERREQRKLARNFYKEDRKNQKKERRSKKATEGVDDEAEMSEDGGHTDDDDEDDIETARAEIDEMADFVDFREGTALDNDERRNEARRDAHAKRAIQEDEEDIKKMKELLENGFKRPKKGLNGEEDDDGKWKTRRTQERGDDSESESDSDDLRNLRPEEAVEVSDDEDEGAKAFKERQAQRFSMKKASGGDTQEPNENEALPEVDVSMEVMKLFEKEKNKKSTKYNNKGQGTTQSQTIASDLSNRGGGGSGSGLSRGNSQFSNLGAARTSSTSFLKRNGSSKSQSGFAKGIISGGAASRTFVFGSALDNSNSQWATTQRETETMPSSLGNNLLGGDEARTGFGDDVANNNINSSASVRENKKKSLFSMLQKSTKDEDWEKGHEEIKNVLGM